jgi:hypothetical protein
VAAVESLSRPSNKLTGEEIWAKIAANREKRLSIAEAMKREAGVTEHTVHAEDFGGLAYIGTGRILSPEGRKIVQLYTVAHECGHIFLHNSGPGYWLPGHVKEMEAESYAHQAFRHHGMRLPRRLSKWGRTYVGSWVEKDRAAGIAIDPRAEAYAKGGRSPYEPLRMTPDEWQPPSLGRWARRTIARVRAAPWTQEARALVALAMGSLYRGTLLSLLALVVCGVFLPGLVPGNFLASGIVGGLMWTNARLLWRTVTC